MIGQPQRERAKPTLFPSELPPSALGRHCQHTTGTRRGKRHFFLQLVDGRYPEPSAIRLEPRFLFQPLPPLELGGPCALAPLLLVAFTSTLLLRTQLPACCTPPNMENTSKDVDQTQYIDNAMRAVREKKPLPEIDFTLHTMEDGTQVNTTERVCKGMLATQ